MADFGGYRILLIGSPSRVFTDGPVSLKHSKNIFEAIRQAKEQPCEHIYVVYSQLPEPKSEALEALHAAYPKSSVCLLVRMADEPFVRQWLHTCSWSSGIPDYVICPISVELFKPEKQYASRDVCDLADQLREKDRRIRELETLVMQDDLTGLKNRRYLKHFLPMIMNKAKADHCRITLLLFDIDDFKHYNDSYGHSVGDNVLRQTAELIWRCCRTQDVVARLGGDEFAVVFWDTGNQKAQSNTSQTTDRRISQQNHPREALFMAERFRKEMSEAVFDLLGEKGKGRLTISGGLATFPDDAEIPEKLFERADQALLEAKRSGKNRITLVGTSV